MKKVLISEQDVLDIYASAKQDCPLLDPSLNLTKRETEMLNMAVGHIGDAFLHWVQDKNEAKNVPTYS